MNSSVMLSAPSTRQSPSSMILGELDRSMKYYGAMADLLGGRLGVCAAASVLGLIQPVQPHAFARASACVRTQAGAFCNRTSAKYHPPPSNSPAFEAHSLKRRVRKLVDCTVEVPQAADSRVLSPKSNGVQYDEYRDDSVEYSVGLEAPAHATDTTVEGWGHGDLE